MVVPRKASAGDLVHINQAFAGLDSDPGGALDPRIESIKKKHDIYIYIYRLRLNSVKQIEQIWTGWTDLNCYHAICFGDNDIANRNEQEVNSESYWIVSEVKLSSRDTGKIAHTVSTSSLWLRIL